MAVIDPRVFWRRNSQVVRLAKQFRWRKDEGKIFRRDEQIVSREKEGTSTRLSQLSRLRAERVVKIGRWKRDELYDQVEPVGATPLQPGV